MFLCVFSFHYLSVIWKRIDIHLIMLLSVILAIVAYLPKSKADKRKSLLGGSKGSEEGEMVSEVHFFTKKPCFVTFSLIMLAL